jgi:putative ABC transport system permease protein
MIGKESVFYALRNMKHSWARSSLTIFSIFVGIMTIFIFISFGWGIYDYVDDLTSSSSADKLMIQAVGNGMPGMDDAFALTEDDLKSIEKTAGIKEAVGVKYGVATIKKSGTLKYTFLISLDPENLIMLEMNNIGIDSGRMFSSGETGKVILGHNYKIADKIFDKSISLNDQIEVNGQSMKVIGFMEEIGNPQDDSQVYISDDYFDKILPNSSYAMIIASVEDTKTIKQTIENVEKSLRKERGVDEGEEDFFVTSYQDMLESFMVALNIIIGFVILIALISVIVSAVNTANTMITSVLERYKEIGILKSIGAKNSEIFEIFLFESSVFGFISGAIGVFLGWVATSLAGIYLKNMGWGFLQPHYSVSLFAGCILFAMITGAISGVIPVYNASRINTVDALRYE